MSLDHTNDLDTILETSDELISLKTQTRFRVAEHLARKRPVEELSIERYKPADIQDFSFVGITPKRNAKSTWYRCSFCEKDKQFSEGTIVLSSDEKLRLIGNDCHAKHLDPGRYSAERLDLRYHEMREWFKRTMPRLLPEIKVLKASFGSLDQRNMAKFAESLPSSISIHIPQLADILFKAQKIRWQLQVDHPVLEPQSGRYIMQPQTIHTVRGAEAALGPVPRLGEKFTTVLNALWAAEELMEKTEWVSIRNDGAAKKIQAIKNEIIKAYNTSEEIRLYISRASAFMNAGNIAGIARWSSDKDNKFEVTVGKIIAHRSGLIFQPKTGAEYRLSRPSGLLPSVIPDFTNLAQMADFRR